MCSLILRRWRNKSVRPVDEGRKIKSELRELNRVFNKLKRSAKCRAFAEKGADLRRAAK